MDRRLSFILIMLVFLVVVMKIIISTPTELEKVPSNQVILEQTIRELTTTQDYVQLKLSGGTLEKEDMVKLIALNNAIRGAINSINTVHLIERKLRVDQDN